jgi:membrane peptidoglycan carboxypeptidase
MTELLRGVVSDGTGRSADIRSIIGKDIAGKTGTSGDNQDGWFIGYIPNELATGVWLGNFVHPALVTNPPPSGSFNSADAAWLWGDYMKVCHLAKGCSK